MSAENPFPPNIDETAPIPGQPVTPEQSKLRLFGNNIREAIQIVRDFRQAYRDKKYRRLEGFDDASDLDSRLTEEEEEQGL